jgi:hypothetical protein
MEGFPLILEQLARTYQDISMFAAGWHPSLRRSRATVTCRTFSVQRLVENGG